MTSAYLKRGSAFQITSRAALDFHDRLPAGNYIVKQDVHKNFFLDRTEDFKLPTKLYGDTIRNTHRILHTFNDRPESTGILLNGEKGSGKTLLAKSICSFAATLDIPTILINAPWTGEEFNAIIQGINQPAILLFDEFEKVYDREHQPAILTLLDGVYPSKKLFILTCNDKWRVDEHMRNRPGRIFYMLDFDGLAPEFIREYANDTLKEKHYVEKIVQIAGTFAKFNFDMLKALVEEMNRFNEDPAKALAMLNIKAEFGGEFNFTYTLFVDGKEIPRKDFDSPEEIRLNPLQGILDIEYRVIPEGKTEEEVEYVESCFNVSHLKKIESNGNRFTYVNEDGDLIVLNKKEIKTVRYNYDSF